MVASLVLRRRRLASAALREGALVVGLYGAWCLIGSVTHAHLAGAEQRGRDLFALEHHLRLPSEVSVQQLVLPHPALAHLVNGYYLYGHLNTIGLLLAWTWWRHRDAYPALRLQLVALTVVCMAVQLLAVAPPRLLPDLGFVDLAQTYGESVYGGYGTGLEAQLLAMPSLHVGWAALLAWTLWRRGSGPWRYLGVAHLVLMTLVVVASANHWWADGVVAVLLLAVVVATLDRLPRRPSGSLVQASDPARVPASA